MTLLLFICNNPETTEIYTYGHARSLHDARPISQRPALLIGFAAETNDVIDHARAKLAKKGCDWIVANDVSADPMGGETNRVHIVSQDGVDSWDRLPKQAAARKLMEKSANELDARNEERRVGKECVERCGEQE